MEAIPVLITVRGTDTGGSRDDSAAFTVRGTCNVRENIGVLLQYEEPEASGMAGTRTALLLRPGRVTMRRSGAFRSRMCFDPRTRTVFPYETPYGTVQLGVRTVSLTGGIGADGGSLRIEYELDLDGVPSGKRTLIVAVQREDG